MFKKILIVILILLFIGVLSIQFTVNTEVSEIEEEEEEVEQEEVEVEGFSFDNNHITEGIRMRGLDNAIKKAEKEEKRKKIEADRKKREKQEKAKRESSRKKTQVSSNSFIELQGKVKKLDHAVYDLKNEIKVTNNSIDNRLKNVAEKDELDNKIKSYQQENKKAFKQFEKNQNDKLKSISLDNKVDRLEDKKRDSAHAKAINDDFRKYSGAF